jgi:hypothetical protein
MESETKKENRTVTTTEFLRYQFDEDEKKCLAQGMAQSVIKARDLEEEKKTITSQFASQINEANATANSAAQKLESGFEMRTIDCEELWNHKTKTITIIRLDTGEEVRERTMTNRECQEDMWEEEKAEEKSSEEATA